MPTDGSAVPRLGGEENRNKEVKVRGITVRHRFLNHTAKVFEHQRVRFSSGKFILKKTSLFDGA